MGGDTSVYEIVDVRGVLTDKTDGICVDIKDASHFTSGYNGKNTCTCKVRHLAFTCNEQFVAVATAASTAAATAAAAAGCC